jgi:hypothetical protein
LPLRAIVNNPQSPPTKRVRRRPIGQPTRGKTALNRLRQIDVYLAIRFRSLIAEGSPLILDVGYGAQPWTTIEMLERLRRINPQVRMLGLEIDAERVAIAKPYAEPPMLDFQLGGFNVRDVLGTEKATIIRCYNVLRQYDESAVPGALIELSAGLVPGGVIIEGTSNPSGGRVVFDVYERIAEAEADQLVPLRHRALVFGTNFRTPIEAIDFQPILPKRLIHRMLEPALAEFFARWQHEWVIRRTPGNVPPRRQIWKATAERLIEATSGQIPISRAPGLIRRGYLEVRNPLLPINWSAKP